MSSAQIVLVPDGDRLVARIGVAELGLTPAAIWNPSPSVQHRTEPYDVPMDLHIGVRGNEQTGAKYSPPPFAVVVESPDQTALVAVAADSEYAVFFFSRELVVKCFVELGNFLNRFAFVLAEIDHNHVFVDDARHRASI